MDTPISHINFFNAALALYVIGYQISICSDWSWIPLSSQQKNSGRSLKEIKRSWGWGEKAENKK